jgi:hypothetical protein
MNLLREITLTEGHGPVPVRLTLGEIVRDGGATNHYHIFVLAWVSEFFKRGLKSAALHLESPITIGSQATSSEVINGLKSMSPENQVYLAQYLISCIDAGESAIRGQGMDILAWMRYVTRAQD